MMMSTLFLAGTLVLATGGVPVSAAASPGNLLTPEELRADDGPVSRLVEEFDEARQDHRRRMRGASAEEREALAWEKPHESDYVPRFREIEKQNSGTEEGCRALLWIAIEAYDLSVLEDLIPAYLEFAMLEDLCYHLGHFATDDAKVALKSIMNGSPHREVRGAATYQLAANLKRAADLDQEYGGPELVEGLYETVIAEYAELGDPRGGTLGEAATRDLHEFRHLSVGRMAPDIEGRDFEGTSIRLSDYRGKVVVLTFWGHWCPPCRDMFDHERELVSRLANEPFALVGVNSDADLETAIEESDQAGINWRSFWNGPRGTRGPIAEEWNVKGWPSLYLIDHEGKIANKWRGDPGEILEERIHELLALAKQAD